ncbi:MAG TPA: TetR/AcrR family transcriptional regulator [Trebonia sp.]|nr:TetR/AcrR family transcriptional regulator [Trebonia sp.]
MAEALRQARPSRARSGTGGWQWTRTAETQRALLDAARAVFAEEGFASASITDIVERAGSSVGSLYHHFGGKSELFLALWQEYSGAQEEAAGRAIAQGRRTGVTDPLVLFSAGAKAYLEGCWQRRDLAVLFSTGDAPPGFGTLQRADGYQWISALDSTGGTLGGPGESAERLYVTVLTSLVREGAVEVAAARNRRQATRTISAVLEYARRLMADGPWRPPVRAAG